MPYPAHLAQLLAMQKDASHRPSGAPGAVPAPGQQIPGGNTLRRYGKIMPDDYDYDDAQSALLPENDDTPGAFENRMDYRMETGLARIEREYRAELGRINRNYRGWERDRAAIANKELQRYGSRPLNTPPPISNEPLQPSPLVRNVPFQPSPAPMGVVDQRMPPKRAIPFDRMQMNRSY
jgi:hypothetical protein